MNFSVFHSPAADRKSSKRNYLRICRYIGYCEKDIQLGGVARNVQRKKERKKLRKLVTRSEGTIRGIVRWPPSKGVKKEREGEKFVFRQISVVDGRS